MKSKARKPFADSAILGARLTAGASSGDVAAPLGHERSPMIDIILPAEWYTEAAIRQWPHLEAFAVIAKCANQHQVKTAMLLGFCRLGRGRAAASGQAAVVPTLASLIIDLDQYLDRMFDYCAN
jgi:hypothetical protein